MKKLFAFATFFVLCAVFTATFFTVTEQAQKRDDNSLKETKFYNAPNYVPGEILVQFKSETSETAARNDLDNINAEVVETVREKRKTDYNGKGDLVLARFQPEVTMSEAIRALEQNPNVEFAEPNWIYTHQAVSNDPYYTNGSLWGMYGDATTPANQFGSQAGEAWAVGHTGSAGVYVGVIDEGIQFDHPDLLGQVWTNPYDPADGVDND
ncbi:MAG: peptidase S8, partial [Acidobacteriota bacterium]|nr:peptidase S8 [Acidobacteriota bacterium]